MQWHWSQLALAARSKLSLLGPLWVNHWSNLAKVDKNHWVAWVWCRNMKNVVSGLFWPILTFNQPRVDQGHFGQFDLKWHFGCSDARTSCATSIYILPRTHGEKIIFLEFLRSSTQIEGGQNTVFTSLSYKIIDKRQQLMQ